MVKYKKGAIKRLTGLSKFGNFIYDRIAELNTTQQELAEKIDIPDSTLSRYIRGNPDELKASVIAKLAEGLDVPFSQLMALAGYPLDQATLERNPNARLADLAASFPWLAPMAEELTDLLPEDREAVLAYIETIQRRKKRDGHQS